MSFEWKEFLELARIEASKTVEESVRLEDSVANLIDIGREDHLTIRYNFERVIASHVCAFYPSI